MEQEQQNGILLHEAAPMNDNPINFFQVRARQLGNTALLDEFGATLASRERGDTPEIMARLDALHDEISRREQAGYLTEQDWKLKPKATAKKPNPPKQPKSL
jgi:hypothetical protein